MVLLNVIRALFMGLFLYLALGLTLPDNWMWINYVVYSAIYFGCAMGADLLESLTVKWFNPPDETFRG
jgi:hypothetical protein